MKVLCSESWKPKNSQYDNNWRRLMTPLVFESQVYVNMKAVRLENTWQQLFWMILILMLRPSQKHLTIKSLWTDVNWLLTHAAFCFSAPALVQIASLCRFLHIQSQEKQTQPFLTLCFYGHRPKLMAGEGLQVPLHGCSMSNTTRPKALMGSQLLRFQE